MLQADSRGLQAGRGALGQRRRRASGRDVGADVARRSIGAPASFKAGDARLPRVLPRRSRGPVDAAAGRAVRRVRARPGRDHIFRIPGGNDRLATGMARRLRGRCCCETIVRRVVQRDGGVTVTIEDRQRAAVRDRRRLLRLRAAGEHRARGACFDPALPEPQHDAIGAPALRLRDAAAAAVRAALLAASAAARARSAPTCRPAPSGTATSSSAARGHPQLPRRRPRLAARCRTSSRAKGTPASSAGSTWLGKPSHAARVAHGRRGTTTRGRAAATRTSIPASIRCGAPGSRVPPAASSSPASTPASSARAT